MKSNFGADWGGRLGSSWPVADGSGVGSGRRRASFSCASPHRASQMSPYFTTGRPDTPPAKRLWLTALQRPLCCGGLDRKHDASENENSENRALKTDFAPKGKLFLQFFSKLNMLFTEKEKKKSTWKGLKQLLMLIHFNVTETVSSSTKLFKTLG